MNIQIEDKTEFLDKARAEATAEKLQSEGFVTRLAKKRHKENIFRVVAKKILMVEV